jgi:hypothetical protein
MAGTNVRLGSLADITAATRLVRFVAIPEPGQAVTKFQTEGPTRMMLAPRLGLLLVEPPAEGAADASLPLSAQTGPRERQSNNFDKLQLHVGRPSSERTLGANLICDQASRASR